MSHIESWAKSAWLWALVFIAFLAGLCGFLLSLVFRPKSSKPTLEPPARLKEIVEKAEENSIVAKAEVKAKTDEDLARLDDAVREEDKVERRKKLIGLLNSL